jgi:hypothetical protein
MEHGGALKLLYCCFGTVTVVIVFVTVVLLCRQYMLSQPQPVFTFTHPNWQQPADNNR